MGLQKQIGNFFGFTRAQVNGFLILLPLLLVFLFSEPVYRRMNNPDLGDDDKEKLDSLLARWQADQETGQDGPDVELPRLFMFDPNTVTQAELAALGFPARLANQLLGYRNKGGRFRSEQDLLMLYNMDSAFYKQLAPFVVIADVQSSRSEPPPGRRVSATKQMPFDLNLADTTQLITVRGVGPVLSKRIIKYREALGGFISKNQLFEVYGLDSAVVDQINEQSLIQPEFRPRTIPINRASEAGLAAHPYIPKSMARAIVTYRFQHGAFRSVDDLVEVKVIPQQAIHKAKPYLTLE